ncbi:MAG: discoidin domain-containing protein [Planctomycetes bacterium]|nr:discoidin domain-containing protein [Planctomycetota bacterium]
MNRSGFRLAVVLLIVFSVINFSGRAFLSSMMSVGWVHRLVRPHDPLIDDKRWEPWLAENADLFRGLKTGAKVGVLSTLTERYGAVWVKEDTRMVMHVSGDVKAEGAGALLCLSAQTAEALLAVAAEQGPEAVQQAMRRYVRAGDLIPYYLEATEKLRAEGFPEFLRTIGAWAGGPPFEIDEDPLPAGYVLRDPRGWKVTASHGSPGPSATAVIDGSPISGWQSREAMTSGMYLQVDFGNELRLAGVELLNPWENRQDYPRGLEVSVSLDGADWSVVSRGSWLGQDAPLDGDVWIAFAPVRARFVRLRQTQDREQSGRAIGWWWSVGELRIYAPGKEQLPVRRSEL